MSARANMGGSNSYLLTGPRLTPHVTLAVNSCLRYHITVVVKLYVCKFLVSTDGIGRNYPIVIAVPIILYTVKLFLRTTASGGAP